MKEIKAVHITKENFAPFGTYVDIKAGGYRDGDAWRAWMMKDEEQVMSDYPMWLGLTECEAGDFVLDMMEVNVDTNEMLMCGDKPCVIAVSNKTKDGVANADAVSAFVLNPGDVVVMHPGTWHAANRGIDEPTYYYFILEDKPSIGNATEASDTFKPISPAPVKILVHP